MTQEEINKRVANFAKMVEAVLPKEEITIELTFKTKEEAKLVRQLVKEEMEEKNDDN